MTGRSSCTPPDTSPTLVTRPKSHAGKRAAARRVLKREPGAVTLADGAGDRETEPASAHARRGASTVAAVKGALAVGGREPGAVVAHGELRPVAVCQADADGGLGGAVLERVVRGSGRARRAGRDRPGRSSQPARPPRSDPGETPASRRTPRRRAGRGAPRRLRR